MMAQAVSFLHGRSMWKIQHLSQRTAIKHHMGKDVTVPNLDLGMIGSHRQVSVANKTVSDFSNNVGQATLTEITLSLLDAQIK